MRFVKIRAKDEISPIYLNADIITTFAFDVGLMSTVIQLTNGQKLAIAGSAEQLADALNDGKVNNVPVLS